MAPASEALAFVAHPGGSVVAPEDAHPHDFALPLVGAGPAGSANGIAPVLVDVPPHDWVLVVAEEVLVAVVPDSADEHLKG